MDPSTGVVTASYAYSYTYADKSIISQYADYGNVYGRNGQVVLAKFYEQGNGEGVIIYVVKNSTTFYSLWWGFPRVSDFNYTLKEVDYHGSYYNHKDTSVSWSKAVTESTKNLCYMLPDSSLESTCLSSSSSSSSDDDDDDDDDDEDSVEKSWIITAAAFSIGTFVLLVGYAIYTCVMTSSAKPMSSKEGATNTGNSNL
jgi:hypothetical protein